MRAILLIRCLPKMSPSSSTHTGSQIATWRRSFNMNTSRIQLRSSITVDGKDVRPTTGVSSPNPAQCDILPHRQSQLSDLTIRLYITTSLKSISLKRWLYHQMFTLRFLHFGDRQTDKQMDSINALSRSLIIIIIMMMIIVNSVVFFVVCEHLVNLLSWLARPPRQTLGDHVGVVISSSTEAEVGWSHQSVCVHSYCQINWRVSLELAVMIGPTGYQSKELINLWWWFGPRYRFKIRHHCGMKDLRRFISVSHTFSGWCSRHSAKWLTPTR